eukprot:scaffold327732_cov53-Attheya_sp.AAC.1
MDNGIKMRVTLTNTAGQDKDACHIFLVLWTKQGLSDYVWMVMERRPPVEVEMWPENDSGDMQWLHDALLDYDRGDCNNPDYWKYEKNESPVQAPAW